MCSKLLCPTNYFKNILKYAEYFVYICISEYALHYKEKYFQNVWLKSLQIIESTELFWNLNLSIRRLSLKCLINRWSVNYFDDFMEILTIYLINGPLEEKLWAYNSDSLFYKLTQSSVDFLAFRNCTSYCCIHEVFV